MIVPSTAPFVGLILACLFGPWFLLYLWGLAKRPHCPACGLVKSPWVTSSGRVVCPKCRRTIGRIKV